MQLSSNIPVLSIQDESRLFMKLDYDASELITYAQNNITCEESNNYIAHDSNIENYNIIKKIKRDVFAEYPMQSGWCYGKGTKMNGVEWHNSFEVCVACTDCCLILGDYFDIENDTYDSSKAICLKLNKGDVVRLNPLTLHLAPLNTSNEFKVAILLPMGTNSPLKDGIDGTLRMVNKWLLVHPENTKGISLGGKIGVIGDNISVIK